MLLDGEFFDSPFAHRTIWVGGIATGEHRVRVSAPGRQAREFTATWTEGEAKSLVATLPALPPPAPPPTSPPIKPPR